MKEECCRLVAYSVIIFSKICSPIILSQETVNNQLNKTNHELNSFKWPVTISNEIDTFFEIHDWKVSLTATEEKMVKQLREPRRTRVKLIKICEHILIDLNSSEPDIEDLNTEIDSYENKLLSRIVDPLKRRNTFCNALVWGKIRRNKIHDWMEEGTKVKKYNFFTRDTWNECLGIFVNVLSQQGLREKEEELNLIDFHSAESGASPT